MILVHHLGGSQSERIVWLCEELAIPYELKCYNRDPVTRLAPAEYKDLHPLGTAPIISDGNLTLPESGAIVEYIIGRYGDGRLQVGPESPDFANYVFWFNFANASMVPNMTLPMILSIAGDNAGSHPGLQWVDVRRESSLALVNNRLGEAPYFAGDEFSAADIMMFFPLSTQRYFTPFDLAKYPHIAAYLKRVGVRPAYQLAMRKGDPALTPMLS